MMMLWMSETSLCDDKILNVNKGQRFVMNSCSGKNKEPVGFLLLNKVNYKGLPAREGRLAQRIKFLV